MRTLPVPAPTVRVTNAPASIIGLPAANRRSFRASSTNRGDAVSDRVALEFHGGRIPDGRLVRSPAAVRVLVEDVVLDDVSEVTAAVGGRGSTQSITSVIVEGVVEHMIAVVVERLVRIHLEVQRPPLIRVKNVSPDDAVLPAILDAVVPVIPTGSPGIRERVPFEEIVLGGVEFDRGVADAFTIVDLGRFLIGVVETIAPDHVEISAANAQKAMPCLGERVAIHDIPVGFLKDQAIVSLVKRIFENIYWALHELQAARGPVGVRHGKPVVSNYVECELSTRPQPTTSVTQGPR